MIRRLYPRLLSFAKDLKEWLRGIGYAISNPYGYLRGYNHIEDEYRASKQFREERKQGKW